MCISDINVQCPRLLEETPSTEDVGRRATQHCSGVVPGENSNFESCVMKNKPSGALRGVPARSINYLARLLRHLQFALIVPNYRSMKVPKTC